MHAPPPVVWPNNNTHSAHAAVVIQTSQPHAADEGCGLCALGAALVVVIVSTIVVPVGYGHCGGDGACLLRMGAIGFGVGVLLCVFAMIFYADRNDPCCLFLDIENASNCAEICCDCIAAAANTS